MWVHMYVLSRLVSIYTYNPRKFQEVEILKWLREWFEWFGWGGVYPGKKPGTLAAWYLSGEVMVSRAGSSGWASVVEWVVRTHFFEIAKRLRHSFLRKHEEVVLPCKFLHPQTVFSQFDKLGRLERTVLRPDPDFPDLGRLVWLHQGF